MSLIVSQLSRDVHRNFTLTMLLSLLVLVVFLAWVPTTEGHGRLMDPPARNSMWRLGFPNPVNYNDNELYCGGRVTQWVRNQGKCGVCGDPHHLRRDHEVGGKYANGIISREYAQGEVIDVTVHITANHKGYFEFRICPVKDPKVEVTQECLDKHLMPLANGDGNRYELPEGKSNQFFNVSLQLPPDVVCDQCVIQWKYRTGNTWDKDDTGEFCVGCGPQEEFYNCADVTVHPKSGSSKSNQSKQQKSGHQHGDKEDTKLDDVKHLKQKNLLFTNERTKTENSIYDKITDYGRKKAEYLKGLNNQQYSGWTDAGKQSSFIGNSAGGSQQNLAAKARFSYIQDAYANANPNTKLVPMSPQMVAYRWKAGNLDSPEMEQIRKRFGYGSSLDDGYNKNNSPDMHIKKSGQYQNNARTEMGGASSNSGKKISSPHGNPNFRSNNHHDNHEISTTPKAIHGHVTEKPGTNNGHPMSNKEALQLHSQLRSLLKNNQLDHKQKDDFLKRWKVLRLRHLAATKTSDAPQTQASSKTQHKYVQQMKRMKNFISLRGKNGGKQGSGSHSGSPFSPPPQLASDDLYHKQTVTSKDQQPVQKVTSSTGHKIQRVTSLKNKVAPPTTPAPTNSIPTPTKKTSREKYLKKKLPSWLITALKLKFRGEHHHHDEDDDNENIDDKLDQTKKTTVHHTDKSNVGKIKDSNPHADDVSHSSNRQNENDNQRQRGSYATIAQRTDKSEDYHVDVVKTDVHKKNIIMHKNPPNSKPSSHETQRQSEERQAFTKAIPNWLRPTSPMPKDNEEKKRTESLVRYIVSLLLSKRDRSSDDTTHDDNTQSETSKMEAKVDKIHTMTTWLTPTPPRPVETTNQPPEETYKSDKSQQENKGTEEIAIETQQKQKSEHSVQRSSFKRVESQPFNNLVLGTGYSYNNQEAAHANFANQRNPHSYDNTVISRINSIGDNIRNRESNNLVYQQSYNIPQSQSQFSQNGWVDGHPTILPTVTNDNHHLWTARAKSRQGFYTKQQEEDRSKLVCESLVPRAGMDQWCTDNCNANFCPPSLCACRKKPPVSTYAAHVASVLRYPSLNPWQNQPLVASGNILFGQPYNSEAYMSRGSNSANNGRLLQFPGNRHNGLLISPFYNTFIAGSAPQDQPIIYNNGNAGLANALTNNLIGSQKSQYQSEGYISNNLGPNSYYSQQATNPIGQSGNYNILTNSVIGQNGLQGKHGHFRRSSVNKNNNMASDGLFQQRGVHPTIQPEFSWLTTANPQTQSQNMNRNDNMVNPIPAPQIHNQNHENNNNNNNNNFYDTNNNVIQTVGQSYVGQNQFYHQNLGPELHTEQAGNLHTRLRCKAIGAYAGLDHFDEWCNSTCLSTMCPLLVCSCES